MCPLRPPVLTPMVLYIIKMVILCMHACRLANDSFSASAVTVWIQICALITSYSTKSLHDFTDD
jgi:hypothetical protein